MPRRMIIAITTLDDELDIEELTNELAARMEPALVTTQVVGRGSVTASTFNDETIEEHIDGILHPDD